MIDAFGDEQLIPIAKARRLFPGPPSAKTLYEWYKIGLADPLDVTKRIKLDTVKVGKFRFTSIEAMRRFLEEQNQDPEDIVIFDDEDD